MSAQSTRDVMDRYFAAMGADEDFSPFFTGDVTWTMVDSGQQVRGPAPVRAYILDLHERMSGGEQRELVVADGHALLEGSSAAPGGAHPDLTYCLVYDVGDGRISAMRCYGTLARLMGEVDQRVAAAGAGRG